MGISHATCADDPNQVKSEHEMILAGQRYALDPTHTDSVDETCDHDAGGCKVRPERKKHAPNPQPREPTIVDEKESEKPTTED